jgi:hypothetical protein
MGLHQMKNFFTSKETVTRIKKMNRMGENLRQLFWETGLISRIHKELKKLNFKRTNNPINKWVNELNIQFSEVHVIIKYIKKCSASWALKEVQIKNHTEIPSYPSQNGYYQENNKFWRTCREKEPPYTVGAM